MMPGNTQTIELRERARVSCLRSPHISHLTAVLTQFYMKRKEWKLAVSALDVVLVKPTDEDVLWMPDIDSLLLRSQVRLRLADKTGALEDAVTVTSSLALNHPKTPKAIVLKAQVRIYSELTARLTMMTGRRCLRWEIWRRL